MVDKSDERSCLVNCTKLNLLMVGQAFCLKNKKGVADGKFMTFDHDGKMLVFDFDEDYGGGPKKGAVFHGKLADTPHTIPIDNLKLDD